MQEKPLLPAKRGRGKPRKDIPPDALEVIRQAAATGASKRGVALVLGCAPSTFQKWLEENDDLREAFEDGREVERQTLHNVLYNAAIGGQGKDSLIASMFLLKARHGYIEGDKAQESNRVSINFQMPGALPLAQFEVIQNDPDRH